MAVTPVWGLRKPDGTSAFDPNDDVSNLADDTEAALNSLPVDTNEGLIFKYGVKSVTTNASGDYTLNFGSSFPTSCDHVMILDGMNQTAAGFGTMIHRIGTRSPGQVTARALNSKDGSAVNAVTINVLWLAIGH